MKKFTLLILFLSSLCGYSQVKNYTFAATQGTYDEITDGLPLGTITSDEQYFCNLSVPGGGSSTTGPGFEIGFPFIFNGTTYDRFGLSTNGMIYLGKSTVTPSVNMFFSATQTLSVTTTPVDPPELFNKIAPLAKDLQSQSGASLSFKVIGAEGSRTLVIQWKNYKRKNAGAGEYLNFQARFHETSNIIDFVYGDINIVSGGSFSYNIGLRAEPVNPASNFRVLTGTGTTLMSALTVGTDSANVLSISNTLKSPPGLTFTWTPPCSVAKALTSVTASTDGATFNWSYYEPIPSGGFQYIVTTSSTAPDATVSGEAATTGTATVSGLAANTGYNVFLRSFCAGQPTAWALAGSFRTLCLPTTALNENFDSQTYDSANKIMPYCWSKAGTGNSYLTNGITSPGTTPNGLRMDAAGSATPQVAYAITPALGNLNIVGNRLKFKAYAAAAGQILEVGYFSDGNDPATFTAIPTTDPMVLPSTASTMKWFIVTPQQAITGNVKNLVFKITGGASGTSTVYIDNVIWEPTPGCTDIGTITVKLPTSNSVKLSWDVTGVETDWQYAATPQTVTDPTMIPAASIINVALAEVADNGVNKFITVGNLTPGTNYKIWMRSKCGEGQYGNWSASPNFFTPCTPAATIREDFDASTTIPDCWVKLNGVGTASIEPLMGSSSSNALKLVSGGADREIWFALPPLADASAGRLRFKYKSTISNATFEVLNLHDPLNISLNTNYTVIAKPTTSTSNLEYTFDKVLTTPNILANVNTPYIGFRIVQASNQVTLYIDDFVWEPVYSCPDITAITQNSITDNSVKLGWNSSGTEQFWQYAVTSTTAADPNSLPIVDFVNPTLITSPGTMQGSISNLNPATSYKIWIRSKCSDSSFGSWAGPFYFTTNCSPVETFTENFDTNLNLPSCWKKIGTANALVVASLGLNSTNALKIEGSTTSAATKGIVAMKPVSNSGESVNLLRFRLSGAVGTKVEVGYITGTGTFNLLKTHTVTTANTFSFESAELGFNPTTQVLAFRNPGVNASISTVYIDDVSWEALPGCPDVSSIAATAVTSTTAALTWTKGDSETNWQYFLGNPSDNTPSRNTPNAKDFISPVVNNQNVASTISGVTPATAFKIWIRSKCTSTIYGAWIGPFYVNTTCSPSTNFAEKFDNNTDLPPCWTKVGVNSQVVVADVANAPSSANALKLTSNATDKAVVAMPPVSNYATGTYRLRFKFRSSLANGNLQIGYLTNVTDPTYESDPEKPTSFHLVEAVSANAANTFVTKIIKLENKPTSELLAFRNPDNSVVYIDDVYWEEIPTCMDVTNLKADIVSSNSATLTWKAGGSETAWQYALGLSTDSEPTTSPVDFVNAVLTSPNVAGTINGLTSDKSYTVWVRAKCGETSFGTWSDPVTISTTCTPIDGTYTEKFDTTASSSMVACWKKVSPSGNAYVTNSTPYAIPTNALYMNTYDSVSLCLVAMPALMHTTDGTYRLKFKFKGTVGAVLELGYLDNLADSSSDSFHKLADFTSSSMTAYTSKTVELGTAPLTQVLAFRIPWDSKLASPWIHLDDVIWEPIPACPDMQPITVGTVTNNSVNLGWTANSTESAWQYIFSSSETDPSKLTPADVETLTITENAVTAIINKGFTGNTTYKIWIRSNCGDGKFGQWSSSLSFTTPCDPVASFDQNFNSSLNMPACWAKVGSAGSTGTVAIAEGAGVNATNVLSLSSVGVTLPAVVAMPVVNNAAAATDRLRLKVRASVANSTLEVGYLTNVTDPNSFVPVETIHPTTSNIFDFKSVELGTQPTSQHLAFRNPGAVSSTIYIDDVAWETIPTCVDVNDLTANDITSNSAIVKWAANSAAIGWQYAKGSASDTNPAVLTAINVNATPTQIAFNNLTPSTAYKIWVRSKCENEAYGVWSAPLTFVTTCATAAAISENFEGTPTSALPDCWTKVGSKGIGQVSMPMNAPSGVKALYMQSINQQSMAIVAMPALSNLSEGTHLLKFKLSGSGSSTGLEVGYLTNVLDPDSFDKIETFVATGDTFIEQELVINSTNTAQVLAFRKPGQNTTGVWIDDVSWEILPAPSCAAYIVATPNANCGSYPTIITWPETKYAAGYKLSIGTTPGSSNVLDQDLGNVVTYSFSGNVNTTYYYTLKPYNANGIATGCPQFSFTTNANICHCTSVPTSKDNARITNVVLGASIYEISDSPTYNDFTNKQINIARGANTGLKILFNSGLSAYFTNVWIDLNDNKVFEPSEIVKTGVSGNASYVFDMSFTLSASATLGSHRMRIGAVANSQVADPCYSGPKGETFDFNVNVVAPPANDQAAGAPTLTVGAAFADYAITGTNIDATGSADEQYPGCGNYDGADVWYKAVVPNTGNITFEVNSVAGGITNTAAAVYTSSMYLVDCDDSSSTTGKSVKGDQPKISLTGRTAGEILYLRVWENGGDAYGNYLVSAYDTPYPILGSDVFDSAAFNYYPNPVKDVLNISMNQEISDVVVMNLLGQQLISKSVNANKISLDMSNLSKGTYLVKITAGNQSKTIKTIKE